MELPVDYIPASERIRQERHARIGGALFRRQAQGGLAICAGSLFLGRGHPSAALMRTTEIPSPEVTDKSALRFR
jgi:hypothetical protein